MIYLDNASTTQIHPDVLKEMMPYMEEYYGNPGSVHSLGSKSRRAVEDARAIVAEYINAKPENIIFTSGGSEANNMAVYNASVIGGGNPYIVSSGTEHDSMIKSIKHWFYYYDLLNYSGNNDELIEKIDNKLSKSVWNYRKNISASFMYVNNELGFLNPISEISDICKRHNAMFITDCVQALGNEKIDVEEIGCDFLTMSAHKIHGPKGVGAIYIKDTKIANALIHGGDNQNFGLRGGTESVYGIVGIGKAVSILSESSIEDRKNKVSELRSLILNGLDFEYIENYPRKDSKIVSISIPGVDAETLVLMLSSNGVCVSAGSACKSLESLPNNAIISAGINENLSRNTIRISVSEDNTTYDTLEFVKTINNFVHNQAVV